MIIVSQDKIEIINFDNVTNINITNCEKDGYLISAGFIVGRDDNYRELGYYKTEERAKEVLQEIYKNYSDFELIRCVNDIFQEQLIVGNKNQYFYIYEMPED